jgi:hypothetical protein
MTHPRALVALVGILLGLASPAPLASAQQPPPAPVAPGALTPETADRIKELKLKALAAEDRNDLPALNTQLELYKEILQLDPNDVLARQRKEKIEDDIRKRKLEDESRRLTAASGAARQDLVRRRIADAEQAILDARATKSRASLDHAKKELDDARRDAQPGDPDIARLDAQIAQIEHDWWVGQVELWTLLGLIILTPIVALVFYLLKKERMLEIVHGPQAGDRFKLQKDKELVSIGALGVDWVIADPLRKISRHHCDVVRAKRRYFLVDQSSNGTLVNGQLVERGQPILLKRGDRIGLSDEVTVVFR